MDSRRLIWLSLAAAFAIIFMILIVAFTSNNIVPITRLTNQIKAVSANTLKPSECSALNLTVIHICPVTETCDATAASELILGRSTLESINGMGGNDCILGGGGADAIDGGDGTDVCDGGPGTDSFSNCETIIQ